MRLTPRQREIFLLRCDEGLCRTEVVERPVPPQMRAEGV